MSELPREIAGGTAWERAVNLAGLLAELGETRVVLEAGSLRRELRTRETDLPGELARLGRGAVLAPTIGIRFAVTPEGIIRERDHPGSEASQSESGGRGADPVSSPARQ